MCKRVPENNSPTAALQITVEAERKHISSLVVLHKSRHFAMRQRHQPQIPPRESGPFQFSLTFFYFRELFCFFFFPSVRASDTFFDSHLRSHRVKKMRPREITAGGRGLFAAPAPIPLSRGEPGGRRDHDFLLHPVLWWRKGHLHAEQH